MPKIKGTKLEVIEWLTYLKINKTNKLKFALEMFIDEQHFFYYYCVIVFPYYYKQINLSSMAYSHVNNNNFNYVQKNTVFGLPSPCNFVILI